ncbi:MAG TPA: flavodoxin-dependent (E)-4-hydroxy-3-methylbut-2-enyl-diphosphate synthase [Candidatus Micrarchaeia archaeon]|nr:flavodoxin-dependent (E)-4-hydroxy-3-methylbut-2-enyl-diphosphate synthase [Candidatus Micrarchaeia archaeon]
MAGDATRAAAAAVSVPLPVLPHRPPASPDGAVRAPRRRTVPVRVGPVVIGGAAPISVQTMTKTPTEDVEGTVEQIARAADAGADLIRVTCDTREAGETLRAIVRRSRLPIVADIHYDAPLALMAIDAGVQCLRLNPGNIRQPEKVGEIARRCRAAGIPIRIGVNAGSLPDRGKLARGRGEGGPAEVGARMVEAALGHIAILEALDFRDIKVSLKASDVLTNLAANRRFAQLENRYPLHLGLTEAGPTRSGAIKSAVGIGVLLAEGIGDTIRVSLVDEPEEEVRVARQILATLETRPSGPNLIACPTCGRLEIDMMPMVARVERALQGVRRSITVSVMGCVVNGPGEGMHADIGIAGGRQKGILYRKGRVLRTLPEAELVDALVQELERIADEDRRLLAAGEPLPDGIPEP